MTPPSFELARGSSLALDLLRIVASQLVVVGHGIAFFGIARFLHQPSFPWMQNIAVLVFFLLSGFLIPYSVARKSGQVDGYRMSHFSIDRFARIYPPFVVALVFVVALDLLSRHLSPGRYKYADAFDLKTFVGNLFMLQDHVALPWVDGVTITSFGSARPFWTLAVEWCIYLFFGFVVLVLLRNPRLTLRNLAIGAVLGVVPIYRAVDGRGNALTTYWLLGGVVFLLLAGRGAARLSRRSAGCLAVSAGALGLWRANTVMDAYDPVFAVLLALALWLAIEWFSVVDFSAVASRLIKLGASYAYTLYLIHYSIIDFVQVQGTSGRSVNPWVLLIVSFLVSNGVAYLISLWAEGPLTRHVKVGLLHLFPTRPPITASGGA